jgi:hypothetical protein
MRLDPWPKDLAIDILCFRVAATRKRRISMKRRGEDKKRRGERDETTDEHG